MMAEDPKAQAYKPQTRAETGISIKVGEEAKKEEEKAPEEQETESYNPYLYDMSGPRKRIEYGIPDNANDDLNEFEMQAAFDSLKMEDDSYAVKYSNEKFKLGAAPSNGKTAQQIEEEELAAALEQIRKMEEAEKHKDTEESQIQKFLQQGDAVYELFSILIHSGGAMGGHYYAYIKSFEDKKWYNFNDSSVREIPEADVDHEIELMFGGTASKNTSSYML